MARGEVKRLYDEGKISGREYSRAARSVCGSNEINDPAYQRDAKGFGKTQEFGPDDAGHFDARANRREFPKESALNGKAQNTVPVGRSANTKGWPSDAQVRRMSANEFSTDWY
jgi:hypothetical protein